MNPPMTFHCRMSERSGLEALELLAGVTVAFIRTGTLNCGVFVDNSHAVGSTTARSRCCFSHLMPRIQMTYDDFDISLCWTLLRLNILGLNRGSACIFTDHNRLFGQATNLSKQMKIIVGLALRERWSDVCSASVVGPPRNETLNLGI